MTLIAVARSPLCAARRSRAIRDSGDESRGRKRVWTKVCMYGEE